MSFVWNGPGMSRTRVIWTATADDTPRAEFDTNCTRRVVVECNLPSDTKAADAAAIIECVMSGHTIRRVAPRSYLVGGGQTR